MSKKSRQQINVRTDDEFEAAVGIIQRDDPAPRPITMSDAIRKAVFEMARQIRIKPKAAVRRK